MLPGQKGKKTNQASGETATGRCSPDRDRKVRALTYQCLVVSIHRYTPSSNHTCSAGTDGFSRPVLLGDSLRLHAIVLNFRATPSPIQKPVVQLLALRGRHKRPLEITPRLGWRVLLDDVGMDGGIWDLAVVQEAIEVDLADLAVRDDPRGSRCRLRCSRRSCGPSTLPNVT